jgi:hypothetical protein
MTVTILAAIGVAGCASQLTQAGARVRQVQPESVTRCQQLGAVSGSHANAASVSDNELAALDDVRNRVAALGGNAFAVTSRTSSMWRAVVQADAYLCPDWDPVPGLPPTSVR